MFSKYYIVLVCHNFSLSCYFALLLTLNSN
nr:MAG TPA: hypothetical protein [Bacteriophage sp.]